MRLAGTAIADEDEHVASMMAFTCRCCWARSAMRPQGRRSCSGSRSQGGGAAVLGDRAGLRGCARSASPALGPPRLPVLPIGLGPPMLPGLLPVLRPGVALAV
jgi:hypothetical protein